MPLIRFGKFSALFLQILFLPLSLLFCDFYNANVFISMVSHRSLRLYSFSFPLCFFLLLRRDHLNGFMFKFTDTSSYSNLLLNPSCEFFQLLCFPVPKFLFVSFLKYFFIDILFFRHHFPDFL